MAVSVAVGVLCAPGSDAPAAAPAPELGAFSEPFTEPTIRGRRTDEKCVPKENPRFDREVDCKPAAGSLNTLPGGGVFYWDALEGTENVNNNIVAEYGRAAENDQSRVLELDAPGPRWTTPENSDGGANPDGEPNARPLVPGTGTNEPGNDGALFCADQNFLADGRILAAGGTAYLNDPGVEGAPVGATELAGVSATRIFDPRTRTWSQTGRMARGRWYPTLVTMGDGRMLVASGVEKLLKPAYLDRPEGSGTNVKQTETFDPAKGTWTQNPVTAERSLPLFPRLHLLPNGHVFYNAAGQAFNPAGQSYDEALWNIAASYDPKAARWNDLGVPGSPATGTTTAPGFRGSATSTMLTLRPDADGGYTKAQFLSAGGVLNPPSPGSYLAVAQSQIATVDTSKGDRLTTEETGPLKQPRWYGSQVLLPTGEVAIFSGADRDEVVAPGTEISVREPELFDPKTKTWRPMAMQHRSRTYHNTAVLLPDGRILVGGHAPISTLYGKNQTLPGGQFGPNDGRDPSFEVFTPPNLQRGRRPVITGVSRGEGRSGNRLAVTLPRSADVLPAGPYMLFVNRDDGRGGAVPSVSALVEVQPPGGASAVRTAGATAVGHGDTLEVGLEGDPAEIRDAVLVRYASQTHLVDGDQRSVALPIVARETGASLGLPSARRCVSRRSFGIRLRRPRGDRIRSARVRVDGRAVKVRRGARWRARVDLRGLRRGRFTVRIDVRTAKGRRIKSTRTYRTCRPRRA